MQTKLSSVLVRPSATLFFTISIASGLQHHVLSRLTPMLGRRVALLFICLGVAFLAQPCSATPGEWDYTNDLNGGRYYHAATLLTDGNYLVVGGTGSASYLASCELYDPATTLWSYTGFLFEGRYSLTATLLTDGKVLAAGGVGTDFTFLSSAELYDPATRSWSATGSMASPRYVHTATLLQNGLVLAAGGSPNGFPFAACELYNPATGTWSTTGSLKTARDLHTATLLPNGMVLVTGGIDSTLFATASAELYDPATGTWTSTGSLNNARARHTATLLQNGKVLAAGGSLVAELYDPATGVWTETGSLNNNRSEHTATLLPNGQVLVSGGFGLASAELYDPATGTWSLTGSLNHARASHTATLLSDGTVLAAGAYLGGGLNWLSSAELYGSPAALPSDVNGRGTFDNQGNPVIFEFKVSQSDEDYLGYLSVCDAAADVCTKRGRRVTDLTITPPNAHFTGIIQLHGRTVFFNASVTDNGDGGNSDTFSITLSNGYSAGGTLTSGDIRIQ